MPDIKTFADFKNELTTNVDLQNQFRNDPVTAVKQIQTTSPILPDTWIYRTVVGSLGLSVVLVIIAVVILTMNAKSGDNGVPTILTAIASGAIGALAGLLAPSPAQQRTE
jgi:hypothetical protein